MKLQRSNQQSLVLKENAPLLIILLSLFIVGAIAIGAWSFLAIDNSEETVNEFENEVNSLVESVSEEESTTEADDENDVKESEVEKMAAESNPFKVPLERVEDPKKESRESGSKEGKSAEEKEEEKKAKERIGDKVNVVGLLGSSNKRLAIIKVNKEVQIVKPGDRISNLTIKDINSDRILAEEYGEELTYTFGGGQD